MDFIPGSLGPLARESLSQNVIRQFAGFQYALNICWHFNMANGDNFIGVSIGYSLRILGLHKHYLKDNYEFIIGLSFLQERHNKKMW